MLDADVKAQLKAYFERLVQPIKLVAGVDDSEGSRGIMDLLRDVAEQPSMIVLTEQCDAAERTPSFLIRHTGADVSVRFAAIPTGHEPTSFVLALLQVGGYAPRPEADVTEQIHNIEGDFRFETYTSLTCQSCPDVVQALNMMSVINLCIQHVVTDGALSQGEVEARQIMAVSTVLPNGETFGTGHMGVEEILAKIDTGTAMCDAEKLAAKEAFDVLIAGGGPAGAVAAVYAARKGVRTGVVVRCFGGQVFDTLGTKNFISVQRTEGSKLVVTLEQHVRQYDVDIMNTQRAVKLTPIDKPGGFAEVTLANGAVLRGHLVILLTDVRWRNVNVPGEQEYKNKGMAYCPYCDGSLFKGKRAAVIDGGNSDVEAAIDLAGLVNHVTLLEFASELKADAVLVHKPQSLSNATIVTNAQTTETTGDGQKVNGLRYKGRVDGVEYTAALEGVFAQIGLVPNTERLDDALECSYFGEIVVDIRGQTSAEGVLAAGDAATVPYKQIIIATGDGAKAALSTFDHLIRVPPTEAA